jgi:hypothetical protein
LECVCAKIECVLFLRAQRESRMPPEANHLKPVELLRGLVLSTSGTAVEKASHKKHARLFASSGEGIAGNNTQKAMDRSGSSRVLLPSNRLSLNYA